MTLPDYFDPRQTYIKRIPPIYIDEILPDHLFNWELIGIAGEPCACSKCKQNEKDKEE